MFREAPDGADLFGDGNENIRSDDPRKRVVPSGEDFETDDVSGGKVDLRLEIRNELTVLEAVANALFDLDRKSVV